MQLDPYDQYAKNARRDNSKNYNLETVKLQEEKENRYKKLVNQGEHLKRMDANNRAVTLITVYWVNSIGTPKFHSCTALQSFSQRILG